MWRFRTKEALNYRAFRAKNAKSQSEGEPTQKPFGASDQQSGAVQLALDKRNL
jgi:hypothetical protein